MKTTYAFITALFWSCSASKYDVAAQSNDVRRERSFVREMFANKEGFQGVSEDKRYLIFGL
jgi:hypothetical protein